MIDIKLIRENPEHFKKAAANKKFDVDIDRLVELDELIRKTKTNMQELTAEKNRIGKQIPKLDAGEKQEAIGKLSEIKESEAGYQEKLKELQPEFERLMLLVPQPPDEDVPVGEDDSENVELRVEGALPEFDFEPKDHVELGKALDIIDLERGVKLAGTRNYFLKGDGALLHWAVLRFSLDYMISQGYKPMCVPLLMREEAMRGTGYFPGAEEQTYMLERDELSLAGTAEVPLTAYRSGEILSEDELPLKYCAMSSCFRREAGAAGKDTHGLYRIHQFEKVEQVVICRNDEAESRKFHDEILANSEGVMKALGIPYRVVSVCTGDLGKGQVEKYDIESWMPSRNSYGETHSASRFYEFQARRMNLRYKDSNKKNVFCHTLNNTVIASPRVLIPLMELNQNPDGTITIPEPLRAYMGGREKIG
ncbi:Serine--tRNA ligase [Sedimentisphaera cyanobacteriorum]|uniref:Serine--tRNA ligase n=1 Tax=Sedimentisphaera cyanobacteriorum TaxID=1940790 RepID=A0A1Q2HSC0_9BACT|nr:serine--tRNA ligase [Sedimentisphaera cyanobacteriorum]AQQ10135.1 Serine--tRNA ligase [Sedimentisphaera cyanobacteriorum]